MKAPDRTQSPAACDLVLVGGGHVHIGVLRKLGISPVPGLRVTLVTPRPQLDYSGMLPATIAGHYPPEQMQIDLRRLARFAGADFVAAGAIGLAPDERRLQLTNRPPLRYDLLSLDNRLAAVAARARGWRRRDSGQAGIRTLGRYRARRARPRRNNRSAGETRSRWWRACWRRVGAVVVVSIPQLAYTRESDPRHWQRSAAAQSPVVRTQAPDSGASPRGRDDSDRVPRDAPNHAVRDDGQQIAADAVFCATGAHPPDWLGRSGLALDAQGFVQVDDTLRSISHTTVFAAGDIAALPDARPKSRVFAVRAVSVLAANLVRAARGQSLRRFRAPRDGLALIALGDRRALAMRGRWSLAPTAGLWWLKHRLDTRFVRRFNDLPAMPGDSSRTPSDAITTAETAGAPAMRCAGCGAEVGRDVLAAALARVVDDGHASTAGLAEGFAAAAALPGTPIGRELLQSIGQLSDLVGDTYRLGEIATQHALNDLYAAGATPSSALVVVNLPFAAAAITGERLYQLLSGAAAALNTAGATLLGGHTAETDALALGLCITGHRAVDRCAAPATEGDALILTRALGTGLIFAADMRHAAQGVWVEAAIQQMRQSQRAAADILEAHGGLRRTGVTGFELLAHLRHLLTAAEVSAELALAALPALPGALALAAAGVRSSLHAANEAAASALETPAIGADEPRWPLLFDPQTAGGLLAIVPGDHADDCVAALQTAGYADAARIGHIEKRAAGSVRLQTESGDRGPHAPAVCSQRKSA